MPIHARIFLVIGALSAFLSVLIGAVAAHLPNEHLAVAVQWFDTGMQYHQFHSLALLIVGLVIAYRPSRWFVAAGWLMVLGTVLFVGNLYLRSLFGIHDLHALTPYGGWAYLAGWLALAIGVATVARKSATASE
ncbi:MAG: DUF423 domain-containing protein [Gammaproteobacteria bacterium]|nr:DUF423 domain-containing protein [Gammaproteobacteria bacterium]MBU1416143.1 DUF423 domain-containing protein [Gammaproteobacteria bacterium]